ncbi:hypothetical protein TSUD_308110 [Trifolium subterraneum]|nr:hypothetical protein TSUD_308110 [Trifolium subterraneum]
MLEFPTRPRTNCLTDNANPITQPAVAAAAVHRRQKQDSIVAVEIENILNRETTQEPLLVKKGTRS